MQWDCTVELLESSLCGCALKLGLLYIKGFREREREACECASGSFRGLEDVVLEQTIVVNGPAPPAAPSPMTVRALPLTVWPGIAGHNSRFI